MEGNAAAPEDFGHLPSVAILTRSYETARDDVYYKWGGDGIVGFHPGLAELWAHVEALVRQRREADPENVHAGRLLRSWKALDRRFGDPDERDWEMETREAYPRFRALVGWLTDSGLLSPRAAEIDAPERYLTEEELRGT